MYEQDQRIYGDHSKGLSPEAQAIIDNAFSKKRKGDSQRRQDIYTSGHNKYASSAQKARMRAEEAEQRLMEARLRASEKQLQRANNKAHAGTEFKLLFAGFLGILIAMAVGKVMEPLPAVWASLKYFGLLWGALFAVGAAFKTSIGFGLGFSFIGLPIVIMLMVRWKHGQTFMLILAIVGLVFMALEMIPTLLEGKRAKVTNITFAVVMTGVICSALFGAEAWAWLHGLISGL